MVCWTLSLVVFVISAMTATVLGNRHYHEDKHGWVNTGHANDQPRWDNTDHANDKHGWVNNGHANDQPRWDNTDHANDKHGWVNTGHAYDQPRWDNSGHANDQPRWDNTDHANDKHGWVNNGHANEKQRRGNCEEGNGTHRWGYGDNNGPDNWPKCFCDGYHQSPVDISTSKTVHNPDLTRLKFTYIKPGSTSVVSNNGHTIQVDIKSDLYMYGGGLHNMYKIEQYHFHWGDNSQHGSEHAVDGVKYPIEMHIVSWNTKYESMEEAKLHSDGLAVLALLFKLSTYNNTVLDPIINAIPYVKDPDLKRRVTINSIRHILPQAYNRFYRYHGSLTTPDCNEVVTWTVLEQKQYISEKQLEVFRQVLTHSHTDYSHHGPDHADRERLVNNFRPLQDLNGRTVYRSFP